MCDNSDISMNNTINTVTVNTYRPCHFCLSPFKKCVCTNPIDLSTYDGPLPPLIPMVLSRSYACAPNCHGDCPSCKFNRDEWVRNCNAQGFDVCRECQHLVEGCICSEPPMDPQELAEFLKNTSFDDLQGDNIELEPPRRPLVLAQANACLPDCVGDCSSCKVNKVFWIEACVRKGYDICFECLYYKDSCVCKTDEDKKVELSLGSESPNSWCPQPPRAGSNVVFDFPHHNSPKTG